jgi:hypothetical protein
MLSELRKCLDTSQWVSSGATSNTTLRWWWQNNTGNLGCFHRGLQTYGVKVAEYEVPAKVEGKQMNEYIPHLVVDINVGHLKEK